MLSINSISKEIINLKKNKRIIILLLIDITINLFSSSLSIWIKFSESPNLSNYFIYLTPICFLSAAILIVISKPYKSILRYFGLRDIYNISIRNIFFAIISFFSSFIFINLDIPFNFWIILWINNTFISITIRYLLKEIIIKKIIISEKKKKKYIIYGAGAAGSQLAFNSKYSNSIKIVGFFDDKKDLWGRELNGIKVYNPSEVKNLKNIFDGVLLAIPSLNDKPRRKIINYISEFNIPILQVPSINEITSGKNNISELQPIDIEDLLGRDLVETKENLLNSKIKQQIICIIGGGGSIGSELAKQISKKDFKKLIIVDQCEFNLYKTKENLNKSEENKNKIKYILGNATNKNFIENLFEKENIDIVFHAAAYKHVPIVELNPVEGIFNNVFSTKVICEAVKTKNVKQLLFVSTDKAVRPTNIMGASKRLSELIIQCYSKEQKTIKSKTNSPNKIFSMVRFGNVLNSSGSVVPLFKKQIRNGGPLTITDKNVMRYFMTIEESTNLLLQAATLACGGEVHLLDMGKPMYVSKLAEKMIYLSGKGIKNKNNPDGEIEIIEIGLREGEKLYEELLIDSKSEATSHPKIFKAHESDISREKLITSLNKLETYLLNQDIKSSLKILRELVPQWNNIKN